MTDLISDLVAEGAAAGELRDDIPPDELAAASLPSKAAVSRLLSVTLAGLHKPRQM